MVTGGHALARLGPLALRPVLSGGLPLSPYDQVPPHRIYYKILAEIAIHISLIKIFNV